VRAAPVPPPRVGRLTRLSDDHIAQLVCPAERLVLFGAGHVARAIGPLARTVGFEVAVCDDNDTGGLDAPTPWARWRIESFDPRDVEHTIGPLGAGDFLLIVTRDHAVDQEILERALLCDQLSYLGLIGSRGKIERFRRRLEAKGLATPERWARLHAPIGLPIGSETPEEIAVSVVAELIALRRGVAPVRRDAPPPGPSSGESPR
jgi:xanthine dehydrogenase accessory factor